MTAPRFPQLTTCRYCGSVLRRDRADAPWVAAGPVGGTYTECPKAPNPEDGPMPPHMPGTKILEPPIPSDVLTKPASVSIPYIPIHTEHTRHHASADTFCTFPGCEVCSD